MKKYRFISLFFATILFISTPLFANNVWTIAIDPGHGGTDPGAISRQLKMYEKNVTLSIARELKMLLDKIHISKGYSHVLVIILFRSRNVLKLPVNIKPTF